MKDRHLREQMRDATRHVVADPGMAERAWREANRPRRRWPFAVAGAIVSAALIVAIVIVAGGGSDAPDDDFVVPPTTPADAPTDAPVDDHGSDREPVHADRRLMDRFLRFALDPSTRTASQVPFAARGVRLGLGQQVVTRLSSEQIIDPRSWRIERTNWRGLRGPFSALELIREQAAGRGDGLSLRAHPRCAAPMEESPVTVNDLRTVSVQPAVVGSCQQWFAVDLSIGDAGNVRAVTVDMFAR